MGEPAQATSSQEGVGMDEVETDHGVDAAMEKELAAALADLGKDETPKRAATLL